MLQKVTETTKDVTAQQSTTVTSKGINVTKEILEKGTTTVVVASRTSPNWISEIIPVTVSEGSGEDDSINKDWEHSTAPDKLFTSAVLPSEIAPMHEDGKDVPGSNAWTYAHSTSSLRSLVIPEGAEKKSVERCTTASQSVCHELAICVEESGECVCKAGYHGDGYSICMLVDFWSSIL